MKTVYYCPACEQTFVQSELPNMNRPHQCGALARVLEHAPYGDPEIEADEDGEKGATK
jgi:hypothetical protein